MHKKNMHIDLLIQYKNGKPLKEPVHAFDKGNGIYQLQYSPGFVLGVAADDKVRILNSDGAFEVVERGGNLCIQLFSEVPVFPFIPEIKEMVTTLGGTVDGSIEQGVVITIPFEVGFKTVEDAFNNYVEKHNGIEWYYGNVYDPVDGVTPLGWWEDK